MSLRKLKRQAMRQQTKRNMEIAADYRSSVKSLSAAESIRGIVQQGITPKQLEEEFDRGWRKGYKDAAMPTSRAAMAAAILALGEVFGFSDEQCVLFLDEMFRHMMTAIGDDDLVEEAFERVGVEIDWGNPVDGVTRTR